MRLIIHQGRPALMLLAQGTGQWPMLVVVAIKVLLHIAGGDQRVPLLVHLEGLPMNRLATLAEVQGKDSQETATLAVLLVLLVLAPHLVIAVAAATILRGVVATGKLPGATGDHKGS